MNTSFKWRFFRAGGFDQVRIDSAAELLAIPSLDQKLWVALSCPTQGIDFDPRTLAILDPDSDGHIRASDLIAAIQWVQTRLKNPEILTQKLAGVPIDAIRTDDAEGQSIMEAALLLRANPDRVGDDVLSVTETSAAKDAWLAEAIRNWESIGNTMQPFGSENSSAYTALQSISAKIEDYFLRCQWASFDPQALTQLNKHTETLPQSTSTNLLTDFTPLHQMPLAEVTKEVQLPLYAGVNPAWADALNTLRQTVIEPLLGPQESLSLSQWQQIKEAFAPYKTWLEQQPQKNHAHSGALQLEKLARLVRDLHAFANNFVAFQDFYTRQGKAIFQTGTLYIDSRSCELCITVNDVNKHASLATLARMCLIYCECVRGSQKMTIAAAMTAGDSDQLMVGRNGVFYDQFGQDWDATIVKIIDHPISLRQSFWSPYKKLAQMIGSQLQKFAATKALDAEKKLSNTATDSVKAGSLASAEKAAPTAPFDVAKFAGIFAAIGLAIGAIGTAIASVLTGLFALSWWQIPLVLIAVMLAISGPSVMLAWLKLRHRHLGPLLDANGWAINARACINIPFGTALTHLAQLPPQAERSLTDPYAKPTSPWPGIYIGVGLIVVIALVWWRYF